MPILVGEGEGGAGEWLQNVTSWILPIYYSGEGPSLLIFPFTNALPPPPDLFP